MNSTPITAVIIDDEQEAINGLLVLTGDIIELEIIGSTTNSEIAHSLCLKKRPDIVFLDIHMAGKDGFEVLQALHDHKFYPTVIFTTAFDQFSLQAIKAGAFDYILKPIDKSELQGAVQKALQNKASHSIEHRIDSLEKAIKNHRKLRFNTRSGFIMIHPDEIIYIQADWNYSDIILQNSRREVVSVNIGAVLEMLPENFARINRSNIINLSHLLKVNSKNQTCIVNVQGQEKEFKIPAKRIRELDSRI